jgi:hypothetical protein
VSHWTVLVWFVILGVAFLFEMFTALDDLKDADKGKKTWPLTWVYRRFMCVRWLRTLIWAFFGWMIWHWGIQLFGPWMGNGWVDLAFTVAGGLFGWFIGPPKRLTDCPEGSK